MNDLMLKRVYIANNFYKSSQIDKKRLYKICKRLQSKHIIFGKMIIQPKGVTKNYYCRKIKIMQIIINSYNKYYQNKRKIKVIKPSIKIINIFTQQKLPTDVENLILFIWRDLAQNHKIMAINKIIKSIKTKQNKKHQICDFKKCKVYCTLNSNFFHVKCNRFKIIDRQYCKKCGNLKIEEIRRFLPYEYLCFCNEELFANF